MTQDHLDRAYVGACLEQMGGEAVTQSKDGHRLAELRRRPSVAASPLQHDGVERTAFVMGSYPPRCTSSKRPWAEMVSGHLPPAALVSSESVRGWHLKSLPAALWWLLARLLDLGGQRGGAEP
jgi:hypothetical protein